MSCKERQMQEKRQKILECALSLFAAKGYWNTPVREIIDATGYGTSTFYRYYDNKEDVLKTLLENMFKEIISRVKKCHEEEPDLYRRFIDTKKEVVKVFLENPAMAGVYTRAAGLNDSIDESLKRFDDDFLNYSCRNIQFGIEKGVFRNVPVYPVAVSILATIKYSVYRWIITASMTPDEVLEIVTAFHEAMLEGLIKKE